MKATSTNSEILRIDPTQPAARPGWGLYTAAATRELEARLAAALPDHTLMQRAGLAVARLALAVAPHARRFWIACGPGNNGGDGLEAAVHLQAWGKQVHVTWLGQSDRVPRDAQIAWQRARVANVSFVDTPPDCDAAIDALLGLGMGAARAPDEAMASHIDALNRVNGPVLAVDVPSGLDGNTGHTPGVAVRASHTLSLLTLKPGLYTAQGRDCAGQIWFDALGSNATDPARRAPDARLNTAPAPQARPHASHKGSYGDVAVIGGARGMAGAALLAARAALHTGAGRVFAALLDAEHPVVDIVQPELMLREPATLDVRAMTVVAGCGGGDAVRAELPRLLSRAPRLVLDADALNAIATDPALQALLRQRALRSLATILTPHPLEAARLLATTASHVQQDRLRSAQQLADSMASCVVLKGSGTVIACPGEAPRINPTGNARLASAGTGDVLAGMIGALWAQSPQDKGKGPAALGAAFEAASAAVWQHGLRADLWPHAKPLTASTLI